MSIKNSDFVKYSVLNRLDEEGKLEKLMHKKIYNLYLSWASSLSDSQIANDDPAFNVVNECQIGLTSLMNINNEIGSEIEEEIEEQIQEDAEKVEETKEVDKKSGFLNKFNFN